MPISQTATTSRGIEDTFAGVVRTTGFNGEDFVLIEPYEGPRPRVAYATITLVTVESQEHPIMKRETREDGAYMEVIKGTSWCRVIIMFYGGDAMSKAVRVRTALFAQGRIWDLLKTIGTGKIGEIQAVPDSSYGKVENRARFTVDFYADLSAEFEANYISKVGGSIKTDGGDMPFSVEVGN